jgi:hypothetical protein
MRFVIELRSFLLIFEHRIEYCRNYFFINISRFKAFLIANQNDEKLNCRAIDVVTVHRKTSVSYHRWIRTATKCRSVFRKYNNKAFVTKSIITIINGNSQGCCLLLCWLNCQSKKIRYYLITYTTKIDWFLFTVVLDCTSISFSTNMAIIIQHSLLRLLRSITAFRTGEAWSRQLTWFRVTNRIQGKKPASGSFDALLFENVFP